MQDERTRVDARERGDAAAVQPVRPGRTTRLPHDDAPRVGLLRLRATRRDAVVPDHRCGEADELSRVARVGDDLLVARHRRREDRLAECVRRRTDALAAEDLAVLEHEEAGHPAYTTRPAAIVSTTLPRSRPPSSQEFAERERKRSSRTRHVAAGFSRTRFAGAPTATRGGSSPKMRAGPVDIRSSSVSSLTRPGSTRYVWSAAKAVSSPVTPNGAASNGTSFSSRECGAWSVAIAAIVPSFSASISAARSCSVRRGGVVFLFPAKGSAATFCEP